MAAILSPRPLEAAVNAPDKHGLADPEQLRAYAAQLPPRPGVLRVLLRRRHHDGCGETPGRHYPLTTHAVSARPARSWSVGAGPGRAQVAPGPLRARRGGQRRGGRRDRPPARAGVAES